jgi:hypothetical protein
MKNERNFSDSSKKLADDPNYVAFNEAQNQGVFKDLPPETHVAFINGNFVGYSSDKEELFKRIFEEGLEGEIFYKKVNTPERILHFRSPHRWSEDK